MDDCEWKAGCQLGAAGLVHGAKIFSDAFNLFCQISNKMLPSVSIVITWVAGECVSATSDREGVELAAGSNGWCITDWSTVQLLLLPGALDLPLPKHNEAIC